MAILRSAVIVLFCYLAAVVATPFLVMLIQNVMSWLPGGPSTTNWGSMGDFIVNGAMVTGMYSCLPFLVAIALMRWQRRRDWLAHAVFGVLVAYVAIVLLDGPFVPGTQHAVFLLAGFGAGLVYWLCRRPFGWRWV